MKLSLLLFGLAALASTVAAAEPGAAGAVESARARLRPNDEESFRAVLAELRERFPRDPAVAALQLDWNLARAGEAWSARDFAGLERAAAGMRDFVRENLRHARVAEARLALAEVAFLLPEPDLDAARNQLRLAFAAAVPLPPERRARADLLAVRLADAPGGAGNGLEIAQRLLRLAPDRAARGEAAAALFRRGRWVEAGAQWEKLAEDFPTAPDAARALRLAAESALRQENPAALRRADALFAAASAKATAGDPTYAAALVGRARAKLRLGDTAEALLFAGSALAQDAPALVGEARAIHAEALLQAAGEDRTRAPDAAAALSALAARPGLPIPARRRALVQLAAARDLADDSSGALAALQSAVALELADADDVPWLYRAGFDTAARLEAAGRWAEAAGVLRRLAAAPGALHEEAAARLARLRLEHFLWEPAGEEGEVSPR